MSGLLDLQRRVANVVMQPLTLDEHMRRSARAEAEALIKPNRALTSFERLEIYNRQYWFRVLSCFAEDFPGLRSIVGTRIFEKLMRAYTGRLSFALVHAAQSRLATRRMAERKPKVDSPRTTSGVGYGAARMGPHRSV